MTDAAENPPPSPPEDPTPARRPRSNRERTVVIALLVGLGALAVSKGAIDREAIIRLAVIVPSIILHEISHGAVANFFGDDTAKRAGRLTLNPLAHIDPMGTIVMPTMLALSHLTPIGFAKPVPVNLSRLRHPRNEGLLVSLAGPATNYSLALLAALVWRMWPPTSSTPADVLLEFGLLNVVLGTFNLLPVPPLDGSGILERMLPERLWPGYLQFRRYSFFLIFIVVFVFPGVLTAFIRPAEDVWFRLAGIRL